MVGYNQKMMRRVAKSRGYETDRAITQAIARVIMMANGSAERRLNGEVKWSFEESFVVADYFEMTPKEYAGVFLDNLFSQSREGHFVAHVDNAEELLKTRSKVREQNKIREEKKREELAALAELFAVAGE